VTDLCLTAKRTGIWIPTVVSFVWILILWPSSVINYICYLNRKQYEDLTPSEGNQQRRGPRT